MIERKIKVIVADEMRDVRKLKKHELVVLVENLLTDLIREMNDVTIDELYDEAEIV